MEISACVQYVRRRTRLPLIYLACCLLSLFLVNQWQEILNLRLVGRSKVTLEEGGAKVVARSFLDSRTIQPQPQWITIGTSSWSPSSGILTTYPSRKDDIAGLGNLCFQFASSFGVAISSGRDYAFDSHHFAKLLSVFEVMRHPSLKVKTKQFIENIQILPETAAAIHFPHFGRDLRDLTSNVSLPGYLQSWKYFHPQAQSDLRFFFQFQPKIRTAAEAILRDLRANRTGVELVGVHVRRGDIVLDAKQSGHGHKPAPLDYFHRAMDLFSNRFPKVLFVVLTNDFLWTKSHLGGETLSNVVIVKSNLPLLTPAEATGVDLCVLSLCDHLIQSVGTFGWWAAYLNELHRLLSDRKSLQTVYYSDWPRKGSDFAKLFNAEDYFLPHWIPL